MTNNISKVESIDLNKMNVVELKPHPTLINYFRQTLTEERVPFMENKGTLFIYYTNPLILIEIGIAARTIQEQDIRQKQNISIAKATLLNTRYYGRQ